MKLLLAFAVISSIMLVPESIWIEHETERFMRDLKLASEEPMHGEPVSVSKLRNERSENWDKLIGPTLILELTEADWQRLEREK
jgi:hypothetical protein